MYRRIIFIFLVTIFFVNGCDSLPSLDQVVPDRRKEYRKSEALPDLEVPPDLTTDALDNPLEIPHEEATTLSEYQRRKGLRSGAAATTGTDINPLDDEQWLALQGSTEEIWPKLKQFWTDQGYTLDLNDKELGVMETGWLETSNQGISVFRDKFSIIAESGSNNTTVIYISSERQEKIDSDKEESAWVDIESNPDFEKKVVSDMNLYFYGANAPAGTSSLTAKAAPTSTVSSTPAPAEKPKKAEMLNLGEDKVYLSLPDEFTRAWQMAEEAILKSGMTIQQNDRSKGLYYVLYTPPDEDKSIFSKLKFWSDDKGQLYQISLTGVGEKTELVVLDSEGEWVPKEAAARILTYIQINYNNSIQ